MLANSICGPPLTLADIVVNILLEGFSVTRTPAGHMAAAQREHDRVMRDPTERNRMGQGVDRMEQRERMDRIKGIETKLA